jgi:hypothetical protein
MTLSLKVSLSIVFTGPSGVGKSEQAKRVFNARRADGSYPFRPMLVLYSEESTKGTLGKILSSPDCTSAPVDNLADFTAGMVILDAGHGAQFDQDGDITVQGHPFRSVFFDGWTAFTEGSKADAQALALKEDGSKTLDGKAKQNDPRVSAKVGASDTRVALRQWSSAGAKHVGLLLLSTAHAAEKWEPIPGSKQGERRQCGEQLDLSYQPAKWLYNWANCLIMLGRSLVEAESLDALEDVDVADVAPAYYAITHPIKVLDYTYSNLIKWQDGIFRPAIPGKPQPHDVRVKWNNPDLGAALLESPLLIAPPAKPTASPSPKVPPAAA